MLVVEHARQDLWVLLNLTCSGIKQPLLENMGQALAVLPVCCQHPWRNVVGMLHLHKCVCRKLYRAILWHMQGRGTVVTGRIEQGIVRTGEEVEIVGILKPVKSIVTGMAPVQSSRTHSLGWLRPSPVFLLFRQDATQAPINIVLVLSMPRSAMLLRTARGNLSSGHKGCSLCPFQCNHCLCAAL